jgi:predicted transcriptional regulator of viral defense system
MTVEDTLLRDLHRAAIDAGRPGVAVPSVDLPSMVGSTRSQASIDQALYRLTRSGRIIRVRRDLLVLPDAAGLLRVDLVDLIDVAASGPYIITAGRALQHAELTDQHWFGIEVLTARAGAPLYWRDQQARFHQTDPTNLWGALPDTRPCYALPERALLDVFNHPRYGVSLTQALDALILAVSRDTLFLDRLHTAVIRYGAGARNHGARAVARRVGLLVERIYGAEAAEPYLALVGDNWSPISLRPSGKAAGDLNRKWRVIENATIAPERAV